MNMKWRLFLDLWIFLSILRCTVTNQIRPELYMTEMCVQSNWQRLGLGFNKPMHAATIHLALASYPRDFHCCLNVSSDQDLAAEISYVNLPVDPITHQCLDYLSIITENDWRNLCYQGDLVQQDSTQTVSYTVEASREMMICFKANSNASVPLDLTQTENEDSDYELATQPYDFTVRLLAFASELSSKQCHLKFEGFLCPDSRRCLPKSLVCDGEEDCQKGQDETQPECSIEQSKPSDPEGPQVPIKIYPLQTFFFITLLMIVLVALGCVWYCFPKVKQYHDFRRRDIGNVYDNHQPPDDTVERQESSHRSEDSPTSETRETALEMSQPLQDNDIMLSVLHASRALASERLRCEEPPPSYDSLFPNKSEDNQEENKPT